MCVAPFAIILPLLHSYFICLNLTLPPRVGVVGLITLSLHKDGRRDKLVGPSFICVFREKGHDIKDKEKWGNY